MGGHARFVVGTLCGLDREGIVIEGATFMRRLVLRPVRHPSRHSRARIAGGRAEEEDWRAAGAARWLVGQSVEVTQRLARPTRWLGVVDAESWRGKCFRRGLPGGPTGGCMEEVAVRCATAGEGCVRVGIVEVRKGGKIKQRAGVCGIADGLRRLFAVFAVRAALPGGDREPVEGGQGARSERRPVGGVCYGSTWFSYGVWGKCSEGGFFRRSKLRHFLFDDSSRSSLANRRANDAA